jgi:enoyl-CoA hydratase
LVYKRRIATCSGKTFIEDLQWDTILVEKRKGVGVITLNRPQALNALNSQLIAEINQALDQFERDAEIGCMVLAGSEKPLQQVLILKKWHS